MSGHALPRHGKLPSWTIAQLTDLLSAERPSRRLVVWLLAVPQPGAVIGYRVCCFLSHKNSLWRQTAVVLPPPRRVNLFFTVGRSKKFQGRDHKNGGVGRRIKSQQRSGE